MAAGRPILVTGSHRSGSTWVGRMLALAPQVVYLHEPFNNDYFEPGRCSARFPFRFTYVTAENEAPYYAPLRRTAALEYNWRGALAAARRPGDVQHVWRQTRAWRRHRQAGDRALLKDPLALLSAEWLAQRLDTAVIVVIRHPAAFVSSVKRFNWRSPLAELLQQPLLLRDYLHPFAAEIASFAQETHAVVAQAAVFWKMLYHVVGCYQEAHDDWCFVRHEDLSREPQAGFARLYAFLGLPFTEQVRAQIGAFSGRHNPADIGAQTGVAQIDSRANIWRWKERLTEEEIATVRRLTQPVAGQFYGNGDW